ncbi:hypothetical protein KSP39_PZI017395 [Platanthera zijinensis]|uniref:Reverse transcriptase RNase H-like domain-containing protein n=1 Tax=Platanthera zijinensis TaxID=2320716 RepID=A0AAP0FZS0_9ASPA
MQLSAEPHPHPYRVHWVDKLAIQVFQRSLVPIRLAFLEDKVWCDVISMDVAHALLGRPWLYDRDATCYDRSNTRVFFDKGRKITLTPTQPRDSTKGQVESSISVGSARPLHIPRKGDFLRESLDSRVMFVVAATLASDATTDFESVDPDIRRLLAEYTDIMPEELPDEIPPMMDIQHTIDLVPGASLPNLPHYLLNPTEHAELKQQVDDLLQKNFIRESLSPCAVPTLLTPKKDGSWRMCIDSRDINKITVKYRFLIPRLDDLLDEMVGAQIFTKIDPRSEYHQIRGISSRISVSQLTPIGSNRRECPGPANIHEAWSFHGLTTFYRSFVLGFSSIMIPITSCLRKGDFAWTTATTKAFEEVKERLSTAPVLRIPDFSKALRGSFSCLLHFVLYSDHQALRYLNSQKKLGHPHAKWVQFMQEYHYALNHRAGVENKSADALSRQVTILHTMSVRVEGFERVRHDYPECPDFGDIYSALSRDPLELREGFIISDGYLFYESRLCVPQTSLQEFLIWELHVGGEAGHFGRDKTIALVDDHFF